MRAYYKTYKAGKKRNYSIVAILDEAPEMPFGDLQLYYPTARFALALKDPSYYRGIDRHREEIAQATIYSRVYFEHVSGFKGHGRKLELTAIPTSILKRLAAWKAEKLCLDELPYDDPIREAILLRAFKGEEGL